MTTNKRFSGLMGAPDTGTKGDAPALAAVPTPPEQTPAATPSPVSTAAAPAALNTAGDQAPEPEKKSRAKVQLNTQQPEELKNAVDKAAAYLSFTTGKKVTTTDVVERALRVYLDQLPDAARGN
jgi:hypothetical protein